MQEQDQFKIFPKGPNNWFFIQLGKYLIYFEISVRGKSKIKNILVAQPQPEGPKSPYFELQSKYKLHLTFIPFVKVEGVAGKDFRKQRIVLNDYSGIVFTSRNSIDHFFRICTETLLWFWYKFTCIYYYYRFN